MSRIDFTKMSQNDLYSFWAAHHHANKQSRLAVCGRTGKGAMKATKAAAAYAINKYTAMICIAKGHEQGEYLYNCICEKIKGDLPDTVIA